MWSKLEIYRPYLYLAIFLLGAYFVVAHVLTYIMPFLVAAILAFIMDPVVNILEKKGRFPRGLAVLVVLLFVLGLLVLLLITVFTRVVQELVHLSHNLPAYYSMIMEIVEDLSEHAGALPIPVRNVVESQAMRLFAFMQTTAETIVLSVRGLPHLITGLIVTFLAAFFLSRDRAAVASFILSILPISWRQAYLTTKRNVIVATLGLVKAQAFLITMSTIISMVGLSVIGVPYALVMGLFIGLADVLPIIGPSTVYLPWIAANLLLQNYLFAFALLVVFGIMFLTRAILEPKVIGSRIGVHPLATLFALYVGFRIFGLWGFVIGPLLAVLLKASVRSGLLPFPSDEA